FYSQSLSSYYSTLSLHDALPICVPLYGGPSSKITINQNRMNTLSNSLDGKVIERVKLANGYVEKAYEIVDHEREHFTQRVSELQRHFQDIFDSLGEDPMFVGMTKNGHETTSAVDRLFELLHVSEEKLHFLDELLHSKRAESTEYIECNDSGSFRSAGDYLKSVRTDIKQLMLFVQSIIDKDIPDLLTNGKNSYADAVTGELRDHYSIVHSNMTLLLEQ